jgi:hypothetical protein
MEHKMKRFTKISWLFMAFGLLALSACGGGTPAAPTVDTAAIFTQVAGTAWAFQTQTAQAVPTATSTPMATPTQEATHTPIIIITETPLPSSTPTATKVVLPAVTYSAGPIPSMQVELVVNDSNTVAATVPVNVELILRAHVKNTSKIPLQVVASLTVPDGWGGSAYPFNDCPKTADLGFNDSCTISWYLKPKVTGQVILRVYARGIYTDTADASQRITESPAFIFNVVN